MGTESEIQQLIISTLQTSISLWEEYNMYFFKKQQSYKCCDSYYLKYCQRHLEKLSIFIVFTIVISKLQQKQ
ncbi:unnamed protein product [Paramecium octaurelia]|uniref:Uncharacterized protein n=1 Tax=Paramecium octaurelia TaxID=43137 RepID=A0A8S1T921_PAROT|nr:unnamed protein product [Paramecium octaurelia]